MINYFEVLNVAEDAEIEVIKAAYKALAKKYHPDNTDLPPDEAAKKMALINEAFEVLSDEVKRKRHIQELHSRQNESGYESSENNSDENKDEIVKEKDDIKKKPFYKKIWFWLILIIIWFVGKNETTQTEEVADVIESKTFVYETEESNYKENVCQVTIRVDYKRAEGLNYRDDAKLYIDGEEIASIEYASDEEYNVELLMGEHEIYLRTDSTFRKNKTNKITVNVTEDYTYIPVIATQNTVKGLTIELGSSVDIEVLETTTNKGSSLSVKTPLEVLKAKAYSEKCETTVCKNESTAYTYIDDFSEMSSFDDIGYFDEVVLGAWFDFWGKPIADHFPANIDLFLAMHGGNTSRFLKDFYFIDGENFDFDTLKDKQPEDKATYAFVLKDIALLFDEDNNEMRGMVGNDFISGETVLVQGGFSDVNDADTLLVFGEYYGLGTGDMPIFIGIYTETITNRFTKEELEANAESLTIPTKEVVDLGTVGADTMPEDFLNLQPEEAIVFRGKFLMSSGATGANLLYVEDKGNGDTQYLFFVDVDDKNSGYKTQGYGYIEENIARYARFSHGSDVTDKIVSSYVNPRFNEDVVEEVSGDIVQVNKLTDNYFVCYMKSYNQTTIREDMITGTTIQKEYLYVGDTVIWNDEIEFTISDVGFWNDEYYGSNVFIDLTLRGSSFASYNDLIDSITPNMKFWGDGLLLAEHPWIQIDGENIVGGSNPEYKLGYKDPETSLRIYASCSMLNYDNASEIVADIDGVENVFFYVKGNMMSEKSGKTLNLQEPLVEEPQMNVIYEDNTIEKNVENVYQVSGELKSMVALNDGTFVLLEKRNDKNYYIVKSSGEEIKLERFADNYGYGLSYDAYKDVLYLFIDYDDDMYIYIVTDEGAIEEVAIVRTLGDSDIVDAGVVDCQFFSDGRMIGKVFGKSLIDSNNWVKIGDAPWNSAIINDKMYDLKYNFDTYQYDSILEIDFQGNVVEEYIIPVKIDSKFLEDGQVYRNNKYLYFIGAKNEKDYVYRFDGEKWDSLVCLSDYNNHTELFYDSLCVTEDSIRFFDRETKEIKEYKLKKSN